MNPCIDLGFSSVLNGAKARHDYERRAAGRGSGAPQKVPAPDICSEPPEMTPVCPYPPTGSRVGRGAPRTPDSPHEPPGRFRESLSRPCPCV